MKAAPPNLNFGKKSTPLNCAKGVHEAHYVLTGNPAVMALRL
jgi:hypothetical protein